MGETYNSNIGGTMLGEHYTPDAVFDEVMIAFLEGGDFSSSLDSARRGEQADWDPLSFEGPAPGSWQPAKLTPEPKPMVPARVAALQLKAAETIERTPYYTPAEIKQHRRKVMKWVGAAALTAVSILGISTFGRETTATAATPQAAGSLIPISELAHSVPLPTTTEVPPTIPPKPVVKVHATASTSHKQAITVHANSSDNGVWDRLAQCESSGNWATNTGNGYYGGIQFTLESWRAVGGTGRPDQASRETQIANGKKLLAIQGWGAWPACSRKLGLR